ncbi:hypothetical protein ACFE04_011009 [Oxalis oulophora]
MKGMSYSFEVTQEDIEAAGKFVNIDNGWQSVLAEYHGSARAISGGPLYVSDAPGKHNFELLKKLVLPDGSILRGRPTGDCLFSDPARDGVSFAPNGLIDMFNSGGAIEELKYDETVGKVCVEVRGCGKFGVYSSDKPRRCVVGSNEVGFEYDELSGLVTVSLDCMPLPEEGRRHVVEFEL